ncbi:MAG: JAB domain-containing protein [Gammaproteobacteria bacterium]
MKGWLHFWLELNAGAVIFCHNHPSGCTEPSQQDIAITNKLKSALELVSVRTLDHIIVGNASSFAFAERGLI